MLAAGALALPLAVDAERPGKEDQEKYQRELFARIDADSDGKVTEREFGVAVLWDDFRRYDANGDGKVSKAEYDAQEKSEDIWSELDAEGKGYVTFKDCLKSAKVRAALHDDWKRLTSKLGKGDKAVPYITIEDLPDLTP